MQFRSAAVLIAMTCSLVLSGCATVTQGTEDAFIVITNPAGARVETTNGFTCESTPCAIQMPRRSEFVATITRPGCRSVQVEVTHRTSDAGAAGLAGNVLVGGVIGLGVDAATGASQELVPNPVELNLQC